jgi:hypothetical protein
LRDALPGARSVSDEIFRPWERGWLVFDGVDFQARQVASSDEEQDAIVALLNACGDQHAVLHRRVECARACTWAKIHRRASTSTAPGDNCRRDLSPKLVRARKVLRKECQNDSLLFARQMTLATRHVVKVSNRLRDIRGMISVFDRSPMPHSVDQRLCGAEEN